MKQFMLIEIFVVVFVVMLTISSCLYYAVYTITHEQQIKEQQEQNDIITTQRMSIKRFM